MEKKKKKVVIEQCYLQEMERSSITITYDLTIILKLPFHITFSHFVMRSVNKLII